MFVKIIIPKMKCFIFRFVYKNDKICIRKISNDRYDGYDSHDFMEKLFNEGAF